MSNIGTTYNIFQPSVKCLQCRYWESARKNFMGNITGGHCILNYCKNPRPERRREMIKLDEESVSKIIKIAMSNNQKCNICEFRGMCFFCLFMSQQ